MFKNKRYLILAILWMAFIFYLSHQPADVSSEQSGGVIAMLSNLPIVGGIVSYMMEIDIAQFIIRKGAHMFAYFLLCILWFVLMYDKDVDLKGICIKAFVFTFIFACSDEIHQLFIPGRSGELRDVLVDSSGALIGLFIAYFIVNRKNKK